MYRIAVFLGLALALGACDSKKDGKATKGANEASKAFDPGSRIDKAGEDLTQAEKEDVQKAKKQMIE